MSVRFQFGENWANYSNTVDEESIVVAEQSIRQLLNVSSLAGKTFLDIGCGSGIFSLAARRLGADVHSFDFDPVSVATTQSFKQRFFSEDERWHVEQGSVLDTEYLDRLGAFDVVYAWGVLFCTGAMWQAMENVIPLVKPEGSLVLALYNDQGIRSRVWKTVKHTYVRLPGALQPVYLLAFAALLEAMRIGRALVRLRPLEVVRGWTQYKQKRGMSRWHDIVDWVGGYPFEVAKPEAVTSFYADRGFALSQLLPARSSGNNQFVFTKLAVPGAQTREPF